MISNKFEKLEQIDKENNYRIFKCEGKDNDNKLYQLKYIYFDKNLIDYLYFEKYYQIKKNDNVLMYK